MGFPDDDHRSEVLGFCFTIEFHIDLVIANKDQISFLEVEVLNRMSEALLKLANGVELGHEDLVVDEFKIGRMFL